jgi:hypothetical protein
MAHLLPGSAEIPDLNHAIKRAPRSGLRSANNNWDFWTLLSEALHQVTIVMSDRGSTLMTSRHGRIGAWEVARVDQTWQSRPSTEADWPL